MAGGAGAVKTCPVCGGPVEWPMRVYCCHQHAREAARRRDREYARETRAGQRVRKKRTPPRRYAEVREAVRRGNLRSCLKCGAAFKSTGIDNRLCSSCRKSNREWLAGQDEKMIFAAGILEGLA